MALGEAALAVAVVIVLLTARPSVAEVPKLDTPKEKASYAMGVAIARSFERQRATLDTDALARGLKDGLSDKGLLMDDDELRAAMSAFRSDPKERRSTRAANANGKAGEAFLAENAKKEGVVSLPSGLQYKVLKAGQGKRPTDTDSIECHYRGTRIDGSEFDSSYAAGHPASFQLRQVIAGWREALKLMPVGSKWKLFVPSQLAYGRRGLRTRKRGPPRIAPNATLVFELELLAIKPAKGAETASGTIPAGAKGD
jgi:FKBP-type peptidyl-prolyl cis-trans isomerase FklB